VREFKKLINVSNKKIHVYVEIIMRTLEHRNKSLNLAEKNDSKRLFLKSIQSDYFNSFTHFEKY